MEGWFRRWMPFTRVVVYEGLELCRHHAISGIITPVIRRLSFSRVNRAVTGLRLTARGCVRACSGRRTALTRID